MGASGHVGQGGHGTEFALEEVESIGRVLAVLDFEIAAATGMNVVWTEMREALMELLAPA